MTCGRRLGFSLLEVILSTLIAGILLVAALRGVGQATRSQVDNSRQSRARLLAAALMAEILELAYQDPDGSPLFGSEPGEAGATRAAFDDVDDYHGLSDNPPKSKTGTPLEGLAGWQRSVSVAYVNPDDLSEVVETNSGVKRITVTVSCDGSQLASLMMIVTDAWQLPPYAN